MSYREEVLRTAASSAKDLGLGAMGLAGEAGEVVDELKKVIYHKKPLDREKLLKELGDVRWYLEYLADALDFSMDEIEFANIEKLRKRYPDGFKPHAETQR